MILFKLSFDPEYFCGISPACGEIEPGNSRQLKFTLEEAIQQEEVSFLVKFISLASETSPDTIADLMMNQSQWKDTIKSVIKFSTHAEDALAKFLSMRKNRSTLNEAIERQENQNLLEEQKVMLERKISEKQEQKIQLQSQVEHLIKQRDQQLEQIKILKAQSEKPNIVIIFGFLFFALVFLLKHLFQ